MYSVLKTYPKKLNTIESLILSHLQFKPLRMLKELEKTLP